MTENSKICLYKIMNHCNPSVWVYTTENDTEATFIRLPNKIWFLL